MASSTRLSYSASAAVGGHLVYDAARYVIAAQQAINRAVALANAMTGGGATAANLENSPEFNVATGQGAAFYTAINDLKTNLASITSSALANLDQGG